MNLLKKYQTFPLLWRWFFQFLLIMIFIAFLFAPQKQVVDYNDINFESSANSRLYFHNVRSYYYQIDSYSKDPMLIYRLKRRATERDSVSLNFDIIRHPSADDSFVYSYLGSHFTMSDSLNLMFEAYQGRESLANLQKENHYRIAAKTYTSFIEEKAIFLMQGSDTIKELFSEGNARADAEIVLEDYFKLVQKN
jgi:hypothetical protein